MTHNRRMATDEEWITTAECAQRSGYHRTHIVDIIKRESGIRSKRFGRAWMVEWHSFVARARGHFLSNVRLCQCTRHGSPVFCWLLRG
jgi:hypothetical protein